MQRTLSTMASMYRQVLQRQLLPGMLCNGKHEACSSCHCAPRCSLGSWAPRSHDVLKLGALGVALLQGVRLDFEWCTSSLLGYSVILCIIARWFTCPITRTRKRFAPSTLQGLECFEKDKFHPITFIAAEVLVCSHVA